MVVACSREGSDYLQEGPYAIGLKHARKRRFVEGPPPRVAFGAIFVRAFPFGRRAGAAGCPLGVRAALTAGNGRVRELAVH